MSDEPIKTEAGADVKMEGVEAEAPVEHTEDVKTDVKEEASVPVDIKPAANGSASTETPELKPEVKAEDGTKPEVKHGSGDSRQDNKSAVQADTKDTSPDAEFDLSTPTVDGKTTEEVEDIMARVAKQINFYFSDANLPQDKFFFTLTVCNPQGWVPIQTIMTFQRMREFQPYGIEFVTRALRKVIKSEGSDPLVGVSEHGHNVRRVRRLESNARSGFERSVYVKGFGEGDTEHNSQEQVEQYFEQFGHINAVRKRREDLPGSTGNHSSSSMKKGKFKGSVFAEFALAEDMTKFLAQEELPKFTADGPSMTFMSKDAYVTMKAKEKGIDIGKNKRGGWGDKGGGKGGSGTKFNAFKEMSKIEAGELPDLAKIPPSTLVVGKPMAVKPSGRDARDGRDYKRSRDEDGEDRKAKWQKVEDLTLEYNGAELKIDPLTGEVRDPAEVKFTPNAVVKFVNCGTDGDWKDLKQRVIDTGIEKPFIAYPPGSEFGRLAKSDGAEIADNEVQKLNEANIPFGGSQLLWERMPDDAQRGFWVMRANFQGKVLAEKQGDSRDSRDRRDHRDRGDRRDGRDGGRGGRGRGGRGRGGRGRGGRGGRGGRDGRDRGDEDGGGMPPKVAAATGDDA